VSADTGRRLRRGAMSRDPVKSLKRCASVRISRYDTQEGNQCQEIQFGVLGGEPVSGGPGSRPRIGASVRRSSGGELVSEV
jgi:hypothetical protein